MRFCSYCGKEVMDQSVICPHCGCQIEGSDVDRANPGLVVLSILIPLAGIIMAIAFWGKTPRAAKTYLKAALITIVVVIVLYILIYVLIVGTIFGAINSISNAYSFITHIVK